MTKPILLVGACLIVLVYVLSYFASDRVNPTSTSRQGDLVMTNVQVDNLDLLTNVVQPDLMILVVEGRLADSCSQLQSPQISLDEQIFNIQLKAYKPDDAVCEEQPNRFKEDLQIETESLSSGDYLIKVNNQEIAFTKD